MSQAQTAANRLQRQIESQARAQYILFGFAVLVALLFYFAFYRPSDLQVTELNRKITDKRLQLAENQHKTDKLPAVTVRLNELNKALAGFKNLPTSADVGEFMQEINDASQRSDLHKLTWVPGDPRRDGLYFEQPIVLTFEGEYPAVDSFIRTVEGMERLTWIRDVQIKAIDTKKGTVSVRLSINIYYSEG
jgi:Tfp pilus assembly protein PilO